MRSSTFVLGMLTLAIALPLMSGKVVSTADADYGYDKGELLPSIEVGGVRWLNDLKNEEQSIVVFWSSDDPESRAVNAWVSRSATDDQVVYSVCTDLSTSEASLLLELDNVNPRVELIGGLGYKSKKDNLWSQTNGWAHTVFYAQRGVILDKVTANALWRCISSGDYRWK